MYANVANNFFRNLFHPLDPSKDRYKRTVSSSLITSQIPSLTKCLCIDLSKHHISPSSALAKQTDIKCIIIVRGKIRYIFVVIYNFMNLITFNAILIVLHHCKFLSWFNVSCERESTKIKCDVFARWEWLEMSSKWDLQDLWLNETKPDIVRKKRINIRITIPIPIQLLFQRLHQ